MDIISYLLGKNAGGGGGNAEAKEVEITSQDQVITPSEGYSSMSSVTVTGVSSSVDSNILSNNIKRGVTILGITGTYGSEIIPPDAGTLTDLLVGTLPTKTTYTEGERLDLSGCTILAEYSNGYQYDVTQSCTFTCNDPVTYNDTKIVVSYTDVTTETINIPITVNGVPVQAPAETKGLWHFDAGTDKNEVNGKGTSTSGLVNPQSVITSGGMFGTTGVGGNTSAVWLSYNNTLGLAKHTSADLATTDFTVENWVKHTGTGTSNFSIQMSTSANNSTGISFNRNSSSNFVINGSNYYINGASSTITIGAADTNWHHLAIVFNSGYVYIFVDGVIKAQGSFATSSSNSALDYIKLSFSGSSANSDEVLITESAKYLANFEPPHAEYYLAGGE